MIEKKVSLFFSLFHQLQKCRNYRRVDVIITTHLSPNLNIFKFIFSFWSKFIFYICNFCNILIGICLFTTYLRQKKSPNSVFTELVTARTIKIVKFPGHPDPFYDKNNWHWIETSKKQSISLKLHMKHYQRKYKRNNYNIWYSFVLQWLRKCWSCG